ncbi:MAG TPA: addiction module protein [Kofleriaceae bacterium]|nr:addiction module protein [Kofleriaceae bacterium]
MEELLQQPREVREAAVDALLESLEEEGDEEMDPPIEEAWRQEILRRMQDRSPGVPAEVVFAEIDDRLNKRS